MTLINNLSLLSFVSATRYSPLHDAYHALCDAYQASKRGSPAQDSYRQCIKAIEPLLALLENAVPHPADAPVLASGHYPDPATCPASRQAALYYLQNWCAPYVQDYVCQLLPTDHPDRAFILAKRLSKSSFMSSEQEKNKTSALHLAQQLLEKAAKMASPSRGDRKMKYQLAADGLVPAIEYLESVPMYPSNSNATHEIDYSAAECYVRDWLPDHVQEYIDLASKEKRLN